MLIRQDIITIRNATAADAPQLGVWWRDGSVMAHAGFPNGLSITDEEIADDLATDSDDTCRRLIIEIDSMPVGEMDYRNKGNKIAEIGIKICDLNMQEKGYGTKYTMSAMLVMLLLLKSKSSLNWQCKYCGF